MVRIGGGRAVEVREEELTDAEVLRARGRATVSGSAPWGAGSETLERQGKKRTGSVFCKSWSASFREWTRASWISCMAWMYAWNSGEILPTAGEMSTTARRRGSIGVRVGDR